MLVPHGEHTENAVGAVSRCVHFFFLSVALCGEKRCQCVFEIASFAALMLEN